jgi:GNAT superfamily N-acetyltransferase
MELAADVSVTSDAPAGESNADIVSDPAQSDHADESDPSGEPGEPEDEAVEYEITAVEPAEVTVELSNRLAALDRAELVAAGRDIAALTGRALHAKLQTLSGGIWVAGPHGQALQRPAGWVTLSAGDSGAVVHGTVAAEQRANGLGRDLLSHAVARAAEDGYGSVIATVWEASEAEEFLWRRGFSERATPTTMRRIDLMATAERRRRITSDAQAYGASYQLVRVSEDVDGSTVYRVHARHLVTGAPAGTAELTVAQSAPEYAVNGDLFVEPEHRGHRLGLLMLSDLLSWIEATRPTVRVAQSSVPAGATHVIAILDRLGSRIAGVQLEMRRTLH